MVNFICGNCGLQKDLKDEYAQKNVLCPRCKTKTRVGRPTNDVKPEVDVEIVPPPLFEMKGVQDLLQVFSDKVKITPKGVLGFINKGMKGTKEIPFRSINAVQFKEASSLVNGYIQFTISGGNESKGGILSATKDENTFMFRSKNNAQAKEIKKHIDNAIELSHAAQTSVHAPSLSIQLQELAQLRDQGILSDDEFQAAKKKLIG